MALLNKHKYVQVYLILTILLSTIPLSTIASISLDNDQWSITVDPSTLAVQARTPGGSEITLSEPRSTRRSVNITNRSPGQLAWSSEPGGLTFRMWLDNENLHISIKATQPGVFTFPIIQFPPEIKALILPRWEGCYVPLDDEQWIHYLCESEWNTLEGLCMPFWGLDCGSFSLTYIAKNRYNNSLEFEEQNNKLSLAFVHEFTTLAEQKEYGFVIRLGENSTPIEPALHFRKWLLDKGNFVSMEEKVKNVHKAERLRGAVHCYLWGDDFLSPYDIKRTKWKDFCSRLLDQVQDNAPSPGKRIKQLTKPEFWDHVKEITTLEYPYHYIKWQVTRKISHLLEMPDFYDKSAWDTIHLPEEARQLLKKDFERLDIPELCSLNCMLLHAAYPDVFIPVKQWGNGVSIKMLGRFKDAGLDRMRLCVSGWSGVAKRPAVVQKADDMRYLFGTYDSYHSIHDPDLEGTDATWETAQFGEELYEKGAIVRKDGKKRHGFKKRGYKLSPIAARPYVEQRVSDVMDKVPFNYYFRFFSDFGAESDCK